jgi:hypothetical protein
MAIRTCLGQHHVEQFDGARIFRCHAAATDQRARKLKGTLV